MRLKARFSMKGQRLNARFGRFNNISDGGYERGFAEGEAVGYKKGHAAGTAEGIEQGKQAEHDRFWDAYQQNGERTNYDYSFAGPCWNDTTYQPKYPLMVTGQSRSMFQSSQISETEIDVDFSQCTHALTTFQDSAIKKIKLFDCSSIAENAVTGLNKTFASKKLESLALICKENVIYDSAFQSASMLQNLTIVDGIISKNISLSYSSLLTDTSVQSIIDHLKDLTGATTQTLTFHATVGARLTDSQKATVTAKNWTLVY